MVSGRPLLYLSIPGVAFILGVFWFRRRNRNRIDKPDPNAAEIEDTIANHTATASPKPIEVEEEILQKRHQIPTKSMRISGGRDGTEDDKDSASAVLFGKSAPIKINQNGRCSSPVKQQTQQQQQQQLDSEVLKNKIQNVEQKCLRSIDEDFENLSSPVDLPDSVNNRSSFYARNVSCKHDDAVIIKATRTPKISPENSFLESKYTKDCEQNNNCELTSSNLDNKKSLKENDKNSKKSQDNSTKGKLVAENDGETVLNGNEKRNVDTASPALSMCSEQSGDSGKGSSLPRSEANRSQKTTYEFFFPNSLVGHLYGRKRTFIKQIISKTSANVIIRKNRFSGKVRVCAIEGTESEINAALAMIRQRLPSKRYPNFTMQRIHYALPQTIVPLSTENLQNLQLNLIEGINNDVVVSAVISGGHIFVQHPLHPTHPSLAVLQKCLYDSYSSSEAPLLPGIEISAVCVLPVNGIWYRVQIVNQDAEDEQRCVVKFLDFGGYLNVDLNELRQIRSDFMTVPFQATECILSNVEPMDDTCWTPEAADILCRLTKGIVLQAQIAGYNDNNIPEIYLFACLGPNNVIFINKELVARNLAQWVEVRN